MSAYRRVVRTILLVLLLATAGCTTMRDGSTWASGATLTPSHERWTTALENAVTDPWTWIPAAGAVLMRVDDVDHRIVRWATRETPVFGSMEDADDASDSYRRITANASVLTALLTPSGDEAGPWVVDKTKGLAVQWAAGKINQFTTTGIKSATNRERPVPTDDRSFPSKHTSGAFADLALTRRNLTAMDAPGLVRVPLEIGVTGSAIATAWGRVEAGRHHPSDVLAGAALGNFIASFVNDAFLGDSSRVHVDTKVDPTSGAVTLGLVFSW